MTNRMESVKPQIINPHWYTSEQTDDDNNYDNVHYTNNSCVYMYVCMCIYNKRGVALTGRNATGPPRAASWWVTLHMRRVTDDADRRRQTPPTVTSLALLHYV